MPKGFAGQASMQLHTDISRFYRLVMTETHKQIFSEFHRYKKIAVRIFGKISGW